MTYVLTADELSLAADLDARMSRRSAIFERTMYFDMDGCPISMGVWAVLFERKGKGDYGRVASTPISDMWVSTVWLGLNHSFWPDGPPLIFETMIFGRDFGGLWDIRYTTQEQARSGHGRACYLAMRAGLASRVAALPADAWSSRSLGPA